MFFKFLLFFLVPIIAAVCIQNLWDFTLCWPQELEKINAHNQLNAQSNMAESKLKAFVVGATGAVGKALVKELAKSEGYERVTLILRRKLDLPMDPKDEGNYAKFEQKIVDFEKLKEDHAAAFEGHDVGFCALGTTRAKSGADGFVRVDHDYVVNSMQLAKDVGVKHMNLVSSGSSNKDSMFLYLQVKGQVEAEVEAMQFERLTIWKPGMLLVNREETRIMESVLQGLFKVFDFCRYASVDVPLFGKVMANYGLSSAPSGTRVIMNKEIYELAKEMAPK